MTSHQLKCLETKTNISLSVPLLNIYSLFTAHLQYEIVNDNISDSLFLATVNFPIPLLLVRNAQLQYADIIASRWQDIHEGKCVLICCFKKKSICLSIHEPCSRGRQSRPVSLQTSPCQIQQQTTAVGGGDCLQHTTTAIQRCSSGLERSNAVLNLH